MGIDFLKKNKKVLMLASAGCGLLAEDFLRDFLQKAQAAYQASMDEIEQKTNKPTADPETEPTP